MFTIHINDGLSSNAILIYDMDDNISVLAKYISQLPTKKNKLPPIPAFFHFKEPIDTFESDQTYNIIDIRTYMSDINIDDILSKLPDIVAIFDTMADDGILLTWLHVKKYGKLSLDELKPEFMHSLDQFTHYFPNVELLYNSMKEYEKECLSIYKQTIKVVESEKPIYESLYTQGKKNPRVQIFEPETLTENVQVSIQEKESIFEIFDALSVSATIPFMCLIPNITNSEPIFKIYSRATYKKEWLSLLETKESIVMKVVVGMDMYSDCFWSSNNIIRYTKHNNKDPIDYIIEALGNRVKVNIMARTEENVRGKFNIPFVSYNKAILAELISNHLVFSYFLYFNERGPYTTEKKIVKPKKSEKRFVCDNGKLISISQSSKTISYATKSVVNKKRFVAYYKDPHTDLKTNKFFRIVDSRPLTITITNVGSKGDCGIDVRIAYAKTLSQTRKFVLLFNRLFDMYNSLKSSVENEYRSIYSNVDFMKFEGREIETENTKNPYNRLTALQLARPDVFKEGYSRECLKQKQPYIVTPQELDNIRRRMRASGIPNLEDHGFLEWEGDTYACYPNAEGYIWPSLLKNANKPCCFLKDQVQKKSKKVKIIDISTGDKFTAPLALDKRKLPKGKLAYIPYYFQQLIILSNVPDQSLFRYGVTKSGYSFVECLRKVYGTKISAESVIGDIARKDDDYLVSLKENFPNYTYDEIRRTFTEALYIDPEKYALIFEKWYSCNIIVLELTDRFPKGEILRIPTRYDMGDDVVLILKVQNDSLEGYQCDLIVEYINSEFRFKFTRIHPFIKAIYDIAQKRYKTYTLHKK